MSDLSAINDAINKRAGRKLLPSIAVGLSLIALVWITLSTVRATFALVVAVAVSLALRETTRAFNAHGARISYPWLLAATLGANYAAWVGGVAGLAVAIAIAFPILLISLLPRGPEGFIKSATATALSLIYLPMLGGFIVLLARPSTGFQRVMTLVILVGCNDTFGYLVGVLAGKHPLVPKISPKKTWEGLAGSIIFTLIGSALAFEYLMNMHWWIGIPVGLAAVFTATCGDLIESALKRDMQLKDMGTLLPGHGGIMDRLDSILLTAPMLWLALEYVKHYL